MGGRYRYDFARLARLLASAERVNGSEIANAGRTAAIDPDTGAVTFTCASSGDNGVDDGVALVFRATDQRGTAFAAVQTGNIVTTDRLVQGALGFSVPTLPTLGSGLHVGVGISFGPFNDTTDRRCVLSVLDFEATPLAQAQRYAPTLAAAVGAASASIRGVRSNGLGHHYATRPAAVPYGADGKAIANVASLGVDNMGATPSGLVAPEIVLACWREGASSGSEAVTVYPWTLLDLLDMTEVPS
jgi:hypothetical protein